MKNLFNKRTNISKIQEQLENLQGKSGFVGQDLKEWKLSVDNSGEGSAVIRFLPSDEDHGLPYVKVVNHGFKMGNRWYINNCPTTFGNTEENFAKCPVCEYISEKDLYETNNKLYGQLKRSTSFWAKILVVKDQKNPANDGQVFLYRFGVKIMAKITGMLNVDEDLGEEPVNVSCPVEGANFILKATNVGGNRNYDTSTFSKQSEIPGLFDSNGNPNEAAQTALAEKMAAVSLSDLIDPSKFESYDVLKAQFDRTLGTKKTQDAAKADDELSEFEDDLNAYDDTDPVDSMTMTENQTSVDVDDKLKDILG